MVHTAEAGDKHICSHCRSSHVDIYVQNGKTYQSCLDCGHEEEVNNAKE